MTRRYVTIDGNEAAALIAYKTNEVVAIYPITPASPMGELADAWAARGDPNVWGMTPYIQEMQSEGGAAGAVHGALQTGSLTTTFTASQGLLLMIPDMYKIAGELTSTVFHIAARSLAANALSIFCDHADVMPTRSTGWGMLFASSVQEVMDFALISQASTLESRVPFLHIFDGFRTSHEVMKIEQLPDDHIQAMLDEKLIREHRQRALSPDRPVIRGTAQNPDVYFQTREAVNSYYTATPDIVQGVMDRFADLVGRRYRLFDYVGAPDADRVVVLMGSGCETAEETVNALNARGEKVGVVKVRLFRPFSAEHLVGALPETVRTIAVLDRTKEPGSAGEPLYQDVVTAIGECMMSGDAPFASTPRVIGGRYGMGSKTFNPAVVRGVFQEMVREKPKNHFTVGINDDLASTSLDYDPAFDIEPEDTVRAMFWGLGSDGTVSANKNAVKIIGEETDNYAQGYFVYDSKKAGAVTISHLRFGPHPIKSPYLIERANYVAVHQFDFVERLPVLKEAQEGATFLLNSPYGPDEVWDMLPRPIQQQIIDKHLKFYVIDGYGVARSAGMGNRINTVMQTCFFALSGVLPREEAIKKIKEAIQKTYGSRGEKVVQMNFAAVDNTLENLHQAPVPDQVTSDLELADVVPSHAPDFIRQVTGEIMAGRGDDLPVSALPVDGTFPTGTTKWEKRNIAQEVPVWEPDLCIQCGKCSLVCPHGVIRAAVCEEQDLAEAPSAFKATKARWRELSDMQYTLQVGVEDCTGCALCVEVCPAKDKSESRRKAINMAPQRPLREQERANWDFFLGLPDRSGLEAFQNKTVKNVQMLPPYFEFSSACAGCGETPYVKLLTQLFGDHMIVANATGCSSIYGGNLPTTPWSQNAEGRGPAWSNSLFEDNAEFGLGMRMSLDAQVAYARKLLEDLKDTVGPELVASILDADQSDNTGIEAQRKRVAALKKALEGHDETAARDLIQLAETFVKRSVWAVGGDGWAYDIGFGGLDHVMTSGANINILVMDTEVYSNTGGQSSKSTPLGAVAKFSAKGKGSPKKDLGRIAMLYGDVYVASVSMGANDAHTIKAFTEAESYDGVSLIIAYSHCIAHGYDMSKGMRQQQLMVESGRWPLYRHDPRLAEADENPFQLDSRAPKIQLKDEVYNETRYRMLAQSDPERAERLLSEAQGLATKSRLGFEAMAKQKTDGGKDGDA